MAATQLYHQMLCRIVSYNSECDAECKFIYDFQLFLR